MKHTATIIGNYEKSSFIIPDETQSAINQFHSAYEAKKDEIRGEENRGAKMQEWRKSNSVRWFYDSKTNTSTVIVEVAYSPAA